MSSHALNLKIVQEENRLMEKKLRPNLQYLLAARNLSRDDLEALPALDQHLLLDELARGMKE